MVARSLILIEFNELSPVLLDRFMARGELPNFSRFFASSTVYRTAADEEPPHLEPWIQWPTVHFGVPYGQHGAFHLGDGAAITQKGIATLLSESGRRVGVFGSMNTNYADLNGYFLPDPWDKRGKAHPAALQPFYDFIAGQVRENTKGEAITAGAAARFALFMVKNGLSLETARRTVAQLMSERGRPALKWRRATILDWMQYDVFHTLNRRYDIEFASFFSNSTAHFQHYFWRNMDPGVFALKPDASDDPSLADAIPYGYRSMDALLGRFMRDYPEARLVFCTALSQQPWTDTTKCTYRPHDFAAFLDFAGVTERSTVHPVMAEEFQVDCDDAAAAQRVMERLAALTFRGGRLMRASVDGSAVFCACNVNDPDDGFSAEPVGNAGGRTVPFGDMFYRVTSMRSGWHHPEGCFWVRNGEHRVVEERLPLTEVAPMILDYFGMAPPAQAAREGRQAEVVEA